MIRYGSIEVPRAAVSQLATELGRNGNGKRALGVQLGWAIDNNRESFSIPKQQLHEVVELLEREPIAGLEPLAELLQEQLDVERRGHGPPRATR
ncbi:MAG TPA: hypothetical protein VH620_08135 [Gaiella sp.]|jgi:hypothetical protein